MVLSSCLMTSGFLLATGGGLTRLFSVKSFECFFQEYPRYFEGVPLSYEKFVFDVPCYTARDMAKSEVVDLSKSEGVEYSYEVFLFGLATFTSGEIGVQGVRGVGKRVLMLRVVVTCITKSRLRGNRSGLREFGVGYLPRIGVHKMRNGQVRLRLVLVQKRTRLEF